MRVEHHGSYLAVGSKGGAPKNPAWVANLRAHPEVEVWDGPVHGDFVARELAGDERASWWERAVAAYPPYADYQDAHGTADPRIRARADRLARTRP